MLLDLAKNECHLSTFIDDLCHLYMVAARDCRRLFSFLRCANGASTSVCRKFKELAQKRVSQLHTNVSG